MKVCGHTEKWVSETNSKESNVCSGWIWNKFVCVCRQKLRRRQKRRPSMQLTKAHSHNHTWLRLVTRAYYKNMLVTDSWNNCPTYMASPLCGELTWGLFIQAEPSWAPQVKVWPPSAHQPPPSPRPGSRVKPWWPMSRQGIFFFIHSHLAGLICRRRPLLRQPTG